MCNFKTHTISRNFSSKDWLHRHRLMLLLINNLCQIIIIIIIIIIINDINDKIIM